MPHLFHHDVSVAVLGSGSRGNATYIGDGRHGVLVDCGLSTRQVLKRLEAVGLRDAPIDAVLITHEHSDHVGGARVLDKALHKRTGRRVPFYATEATWHGVHDRCRPSQRSVLRSGRSLRIGSWLIEPNTVPHDTPDPVAYTMQSGSTRVGVITDLGKPTRLLAARLATLDIAVVEFNHDVERLMDGAYPWPLKQRVRSDHGHLSNDQAARLLAHGATDRLAHLVLGHLSQDNNTPELALEAAHRGLHEAGVRHCAVHVGQQAEPVGPIVRSVPLAFDEPKPVRRASPASMGRPPASDADERLQPALFPVAEG